MTTARLLAPLAFLLLMLSPGAFAHDGHDHGAAHARIADGKPLQPADGKVEVVEIFAYTCGHCANFEPTLKTWVRKAPPHVRFVYLPAAFSLDNNYARAFFAAESLGVLDRFHGAAYEAIHRLGTLPGRNASVAEFAAFVRSLDIDPARFAAAMTSPATDAKMREAYEFAVRSGIQGTPTLVVNGRHRIQGQTHDETLHLVDTAIASEHDAR
ncbi:MAG: thiol:disulfide interchange protein DsbA/DsbL [Luteimonas sp.]|nr:thiol:disulfide interchange protein DsbA/DsbL [Luteimonas sp.]